jgi:Ca2+-binding RTX toxin-like protein
MPTVLPSNAIVASGSLLSADGLATPDLAPVGANDALTITLGVTPAVMFGDAQAYMVDVLGNDVDPDAPTNALLSIGAYTPLASGSALTPGDVFLYVPSQAVLDAINAGQSYTETFQYWARDAWFVLSEQPATVTITVQGIAANNPVPGQVITGGNHPQNLIDTAGNDTMNGGNSGDTVTSSAGADLMHGNNGKDLLVGGSGPDTMFGDNGADTLVAGAGADTMTGGEGPDLFVFGYGAHDQKVTDFDVKTDHIEIHPGHVDNWADLRALMHQDGANVVIQLDDTHAITLVGVSMSSLNAKQFIFGEFVA